MKDNVGLPVGLGTGKKVVMVGGSAMGSVRAAKLSEHNIEVVQMDDITDPLVGRGISLKSAALDNRHNQITPDMLDEFVKDLKAISVLKPTSPLTDDGNIHSVTKRYKNIKPFRDAMKLKAKRATSLKQKNRKRKKNKKTHR